MTMMTLTQPQSLPDKAALDALLSKTKARLFLHKGAGFLGSLLCNHNLIWDEDAPTAWCNGVTIAFNPSFYLSLKTEPRVTLMAHELWHTGCDHMSRLGSRCPDLWNQAADYFINNMLDDQGFSFEGLEFGCLDHRFDGMTTEEIYDILAAEAQNGQPNQQGSGPPMSGEGENPLSGDIKPLPEGTTQHDVISKIVHARQVSKRSDEPGTIPGDVNLHIEEFLNPVLPWEQLLMRFFTEQSKDDYSWRRPSRRYEDIYLPSMMADNALQHFTFFMDVSGSVTDRQVQRFYSETKYIHSVIQPKRMTIVTFDTEIQNILELTDDDRFEKIEITGRGGTSLDPVYHYIKEHKPNAAVIFSDLYCYPMYENPGIPIIWAIVDNKKAQTYFGKEVHISPDMI